uniref:Putative phosphoglycolate/pyridoxal phosphate phosphatase family n=1 Tax=Nyssomyia neivai TaxID=330878 RepID=A0A1L8DZM7_9DIPT
MHRVKYLLDLNDEEKKNFLDSFDIMMTDCDGVIWDIFSPIPDTGKALNDVESIGKRVVYVSNNSIRPDSGYETRISGIGAHYRQENIVHPIHSIIHYLRMNKFQGLAYYVGTNHTKNLLIEAGFNIVDGPNGKIDENFGTLTKIVTDGLPVKFVIVDFHFTYTFPQLLRAQIYLRDPECQLIIGVTEKRLPLAKDINLIGPSYFTEALKATMSPEKKPIILGKPGAALGDVVKNKYGVKDPKRVLFVGDLPYSDIIFAKMCGFQSLLVLTGGTSKEDMQNFEDSNIIPDFYTDSIADLSKIIHKS